MNEETLQKRLTIYVEYGMMIVVCDRKAFCVGVACQVDFFVTAYAEICFSLSLADNELFCCKNKK